ncbi:hypothetical protein QVD99_005110 [Batrachochytrium dendrobatidis]|nr:hypothetical protein O5D80_004446 [Batrachochytrium dendrobatidis]KAK5668070.1 hypothetical protein QVD99_005110 [Batrachochytrium dendrobatidis]
MAQLTLHPPASHAKTTNTYHLVIAALSSARYRAFFLIVICCTILLLVSLNNISGPTLATDFYDRNSQTPISDPSTHGYPPNRFGWKSKLPQSKAGGNSNLNDPSVQTNLDSLENDADMAGHSQSDPNSRFDKIAVVIKTGRDVALTRTPIQLLTFVEPIKNAIIIAEAGGVNVGRYDVVDVYTGLYKSLNESDPLEALLQAPKQATPAKNTKPTAQSDSVVPDQNSLGWKADAHKNLPGFRALYNKFPNAEWFVMLDDDTYMFFDNLLNMVSDLDPEKPYYIGARNMFIGCDGVKKWGDGPAFGHGGSGIVLSRAAIRTMVSNLDACIVRYKTCWAGDVRTALCLRDQNILLKDPKGFHISPPNDAFWFPKETCLRPITFHHLLVNQIQKLSDMERRVKQTGQPVRMSDVFQDWGSDIPETILDTDMAGDDFTNFDADSPSDCISRCKEISTCVAYTFASQKCWLKKGIPIRKPRAGFISGVISHNYQCRMQ